MEYEKHKHKQIKIKTTNSYDLKNYGLSKRSQNMKKILFLLLLLPACSMMNRMPSLNMLERRADYNGLRRVEEHLSSLDGPLLVPQRTQPKVADIWVHPHEMPTGDYFRGGWIRTLVSHSKWTVEKPLIEKKESKPSPKK